jgi:tetratricopeptide (TPR) repeat protein
MRSAETSLQDGRLHDIAGRVVAATECYATVIDAVPAGEHPRVVSEALRRLGVLHHARSQPEVAIDLCNRAYDLAVNAAADDLAAEAESALAGFAFERGEMEEARERYRRALDLGAADLALVGKIKLNLGVLCSVQGDWEAALECFQSALIALGDAGDERGCAFAHHNLGRIRTDQKRWMEADAHYRACTDLAERLGDLHLAGIAWMNQAEVYVALGRLDAARNGGERALRSLAKVEARRDQAGAHRVLGVVFRESSRLALAESHLRAALEIAASCQCPLEEAESAKELAVLYRRQGRRDQSLQLLSRARQLFYRIAAAQEVVEVDAQLLELQAA